MAIDIWSDLLKNDSTIEIQDEATPKVTMEEFAGALQKVISDNQVEAMTVLDDIQWDYGDVIQQRIVCTYNGHDVATANTNNIRKVLVGLDYVGNFAYVETKVFLNPPILPKYPMSRVPLPHQTIVTKHKVTPSRNIAGSSWL